jgi:hypothetical protein
VRKLSGVKQKLWCVIPDALSDEKGKEYEALKKKMDIRIVSHRWIDYCIEKKYIVKNIEKQINLLPFPCKVPIKAFEGIKICVKVRSIHYSMLKFLRVSRIRKRR